jgi:hypothetical protein
MNYASDRDRFEAQAPAYLADTLSTQDKAWIEKFIAADTVAQRSLQWHRAFAARVHEQANSVQTNIGLGKALERIQALPKQPAQSQAITQASFMTKALNWLFGGAPRITPAVIALSLTTLISTLMVVSREVTLDHAMVRSVKQGALDGPLLRVNFRSDATEEQMRTLLVEQGALVVGPTRLGDWFIKVSPDRVNGLRDALKGNKLVTAADVVATLPAELVDQ